jgi:hypothetical protein
MANLFIVYWRDIPAQVTAHRPGAGRAGRAKRQLSSRFAEAIDMAAMKAGATGTDAYLADWRNSEAEHCGDDLDAAATAAVARIEGEYDADRLRALIDNGGREGA